MQRVLLPSTRKYHSDPYREGKMSTLSKIIAALWMIMGAIMYVSDMSESGIIAMAICHICGGVFYVLSELEKRRIK